MCTQNFKDVFRGDSFGEKDITMLNGTTPIDLTGVLIKCQFRLGSKIGTVAKEVSETNGIIIYDPTNGKFKFEDFIVDWTAGTYFYDVQFTFTNGKVKTYIEGFFKVIQDVTQNT